MEGFHVPSTTLNDMEVQSIKEKHSHYLWLLMICSTIGGFLFGYDTGVISGVLVLIKSPDVFGLSIFQSESVVSAAILGAIVGASLSSFSNHIFGRKPVILLSSFLFTLGSLLMGVANTYEVLLCGRFIVGLGLGFSSMTVPLYIAEISPPRIRGRLVSLNTVLVTGGQFFACILSALLSTKAKGWRYLLGIGAVPAGIQFCGFLMLPESPRFLITKKSQHSEAFAALIKIRGTEDVTEEFDQILNEVKKNDRDLPRTSVWCELGRGPVLRSLVLGCLLNALQQFSGINTVMYYGATIIQIAGFNEPFVAIWMAALISFSNFIFTFVGLHLVDRLGRRVLTLCSLAGVVLFLFALGCSFYFAHTQSAPVLGAGACGHAGTCFDCVSNELCGFCIESRPAAPPLQMNTNLCLLGNRTSDVFGICAQGNWSYGNCVNESKLPGYLILFALFMYLAFFASGMGPMPWTINSEIYPLAIRSYALSISTTVNWFSNLIMSFTFLSMIQSLAPYGAFWLYGIIALAGWMYLYHALPETKGLPLEAIQNLFTRGRRKGRKEYDQIEH